MRKRATVAEWVEFGRPIDAKLLINPKTGRMQAEFERRMGIVPEGLRREKVGMNPDGSERFQDHITISADPVNVYEAKLWLIGELIVDVEGHWEDGEVMSRDEVFIKHVVDDALLEGEQPRPLAYDLVFRAAETIGIPHDEAAEKN